MSAEVWWLTGTAVATVVLFILPALIYTWYAIEHMIQNKTTYPAVTATSDRSAVR